VGECFCHRRRGWGRIPVVSPDDVRVNEFSSFSWYEEQEAEIVAFLLCCDGGGRRRDGGDAGVMVPSS